MTTNIQESNWTKNSSRGYDPDVDSHVDSSDSPAQVQAEIHRTRERLSNHIDKIQERLQPENIKTQAQDAIQNAMVDSMESVKDYIDDYVQQVDWSEIRDGVLDTIRNNPVPTALIGVGLGWIFLNGSRSQHRNGNRWRRPQYSDDAQYYTHGLGWREETPEMEAPGYSALQHAKHNAQTMPPEQTAANRSTFDTNRESMSEKVTERVKDAASQLQEGASQIRHSVQSQISEAGSQLQEKVEQIGDDAGEWMEQWQQSGESATKWSGNRINEMSHYTQQSLNENPMVFGAVALAVGAGLGMMLPASRYEDELIGDLRQQALEKAQMAVEEVKDRANTVLNEIQPDMEEVAAHVVQNVNDMGKQAVGEVRQSLQKATEKLDAPAENEKRFSTQSPQPMPQ